MKSSARLTGAAMLLLLIAELEYLLVSHYEIRTQIRAILHLPVYHVLLTFLTLCALTCWLDPRRVQGLKATFSPSWLAAHISLYGLIASGLNTLFEWSQHLPTPVSACLWLGLGAGLLWTWLAAWVSFERQETWVQWRWLAGIALASLIAPYLANVTTSWWNHFANFTFLAAEFLLQLLYSDTVGDLSSKILGNSRFIIVIEPGCSGYEGMGLIALLMCFYLSIRRQRKDSLALGLWLVPASMALAWLANVFRLVALVIIGAELSPQLALRGFHSQAGWISFTILGCLLIAGLERMDRSDPEPPQALQKSPLPHPGGAAYLTPQMAVMLATMVSGALTEDFPYLYGLKLLAGGSLLWTWRAHYRHLLRRPSAWGPAVGLLCYLLWLALLPPQPDGDSPFQHLSGAGAVAWIAIRCLGAVIVVPIVEELAFRGYILRRLQSFEFESVAWKRIGLMPHLLSALIFASLHSAWLAGLAAGLLFGWVTRKSGHLSDALTAHAVTNACLCLHALTYQRWDLW